MVIYRIKKFRVFNSLAGSLSPAPLNCGGVAQLGEHLICIQKVAGSIPVTSTINFCNYLKLLILSGLDFILEVIWR